MYPNCSAVWEDAINSSTLWLVTLLPLACEGRVYEMCAYEARCYDRAAESLSHTHLSSTQASPINLHKLKQSANPRLRPSQLQLLMDVIINRYPIDTCSHSSTFSHKHMWVGDFILRVCAKITNLLSPLEESYLWAAWLPHRWECRWTDGASDWDHLEVCCF